jgi:malate dehydrogenase
MDRSDLLKINAGIVGTVVEDIKKNGDNPILILVTNPLDVMAYLAFKKSGFDPARVIGMAGVLDSSRFAYFIAEHLNVSIKDISPMVLGGHGDSMVPLPRYTTVSGVSIVDLMSAEEIESLVDRTRHGGAEIVKLLKEGSAFYAPASSISAMVESIVRNENRILPCAAYLTGQYGIDDLFVGVPCKLGENGIEQILELNLSDAERESLHHSAGKVRETINQMDA